MTLPKMLADICEWPYNPSAYFYPKSLHEIIGFFPEEEHFAMDYDFFFRLMLAKIPIHYHNEIWGNFRLLPDAKTGKDQAGNESYKRAEILRKKYLNQAVKAVKLETAFLKIAWALRNKTIGLRKKLSGNS
jgi:hypothetical protein